MGSKHPSIIVGGREPIMAMIGQLTVTLNFWWIDPGSIKIGWVLIAPGPPIHSFRIIRFNKIRPVTHHHLTMRTHISRSMSRPTTSLGIPSSTIGGEYFQLNQFQDRRTTLDPSTMNAMRHTRPETPVSGVPHSMIRRIKHKYDTGAKYCLMLSSQALKLKLAVTWLMRKPTESWIACCQWMCIPSSSVTNFSLWLGASLN